MNYKAEQKISTELEETGKKKKSLPMDANREVETSQWI